MLSGVEVSSTALRGKPAALGWAGRMGKSLRSRARRILRPRVITLNGIKLEVNRQHYPPGVVRALYGERYEDMEARLVSRILRRGDRVLEIGAGIGFISLLCAKICGSDAVLSYEANPANEPFIRSNFALNNLFPHFRNRAMAVQGGEAMLFIEPNFLSTGLISRGNGRETAVPCDAIADVVTAFRPNCIVMDVEGAEIDLLPAAPLDGISKILLETHPHVVGAEAIAGLDAWLHSQGFRKDNHEGKKVCLYLRDGPSTPASNGVPLHLD